MRIRETGEARPSSARGRGNAAVGIVPGVVLTALLLSTTAVAEVLKLEQIEVTSGASHPSQSVRTAVEGANERSRSNSTVDGSLVQNLNPVNKIDSLRYNATGLINQPGSGDRFGGGTKIRTFGDWGAPTSIDGLPAFKSAGQEGGGYSNTLVPTIAIDRLSVKKGGRALQHGDGTDGGVVEATIKSGRNYDDHQAITLDISSVREGVIQGEVGDHTDDWDYYAAASWLHGEYDGEPDTLDRQTAGGAVGKFGYNVSDAVRAELLLVYDRTRPDVYRNGEVQEVSTNGKVGALTVDGKITDLNSVRVGYMFTDSESEWPDRTRDRSLRNNVAFVDHYVSTEIADGIQYDGSVGFEHKRVRQLRDDQWENHFTDIALRSTNAFTFDDNLTINAGLRHTWFSNDITYLGEKQDDNLADNSVISYDLGASYTVIEGLRVRGSFASGYNRFFEKYGNFGTDVLSTSGAGDDIVQSRTLEAGVNYEYDGWEFDIAAYNIVQKNVPRRNSGTIESVKVNQSGLEFELFGAITDDLTVSLGYMRVLDLKATRADGTEVNSEIFWDGQTASIPTDQMSLRLDYHPTDDWNIWTAAYYSTGFDEVDADGNEEHRNSYARIDLGTAWQVADNAAIRARVENLTNERDFGATYSDAIVDDSGSLGRVYWLGVDYAF